MSELLMSDLAAAFGLLGILIFTGGYLILIDRQVRRLNKEVRRLYGLLAATNQPKEKDGNTDNAAKG